MTYRTRQRTVFQSIGTEFVNEQRPSPTLASAAAERLADMLTARNVHAPIASGENADRKREIAFTHDPFMFFGDTLDAVARVARISVRGRNKMTNFIWTRG